MKKFFAMLLVLTMMFSFAACGGNAAEPTTTPTEAAKTVEGTMEELLNKVVEIRPVEFMGGTMPIDLTDEFALTTYTGAASAEGMIEGAFSESMIGAQAYSLTLVKCESDEAAVALAQTMFDNIDTRKWVCVEATEKQAIACGDLAFFVMLNPEYGVTSDAIVEAFTGMFDSDYFILK